MFEAGVRKSGLDRLLHVGAQVVFRQRRGRSGKRRIGLQRELIARQMPGPIRKRNLNVGQRLGQRLQRKSVHQIQVETFEVTPGERDRRPGFVSIVNAAQCPEMCRVEALDSERQAVDAGLPVSGEALGFDGARVGLERDLGLGHQRDTRAHGGQQCIHRLAGKQAGRAAADEDRCYTPSPDQGQRRFEVGNQCRNVIALGNRAFRLMRVEVAVGAFLDAPRNVDVEGKRRLRAELEFAGGATAAGGGNRDDAGHRGGSAAQAGEQ